MVGSCCCGAAISARELRAFLTGVEHSAQAVRQRGLDQLADFGCGRGLKKTEIDRVMKALVMENYLAEFYEVRTYGNTPVDTAVGPCGQASSFCHHTSPYAHPSTPHHTPIRPHLTIRPSVAVASSLIRRVSAGAR